MQEEVEELIKQNTELEKQNFLKEEEKLSLEQQIERLK